MHPLLRFGLIAGGLLACAAQAAAADFPRRGDRPHRPVAQPLPQKRVAVVIDQLSLANGCPRDPACIPPRVLPINGMGDARDRVYRQVAIPVDPRYIDRY